MNGKAISLDIILMSLVMGTFVILLGTWSYNYQSRIHEIMECMPDGSRAAYDTCVEELYGEAK